MSKHQAVGSTIIISEELYNVIWKWFEEGETIDLDTAPNKKTIREGGKAREASALKSLVELMMESEERTTIVYHDDGSKKQGVGSFSVQGATINKKFYPFPTLCLASETRENLAQLKVTILSILSAVSGVSSSDLWRRIDFTMTDSTSHNMGVDDLVSEALETDHTPSHLICQVHPCAMFTRVTQKLCKQIDVTIGPSKIFSSFAVSLGEMHESVLDQWMDCTTRLVSHDFDHKSWNYAVEFDLFLSPVKNPAKRLQKERFNSLPYTALVTLFLDKNVSEFLAQFTNITNCLACICRSFEGLEYLRVLAAVLVIVGVHLVEPYLHLTSSSATTWQTLVEAFPSLFNDLSSTKPELMLDLTTPAFSFVSKDRFQHCLYPSDLLQPTIEVIEQYRSEVCHCLQLLLPMLAKGWKQQRGELFDFGGVNNNKENDNPMKIKNLDQEKLENAPVHNLDSERAVGSVNYGLKVRGAKEIKAVSSSLVKAGASELMKGKSVTKDLKLMTRKGGALPEILAEWEKKQVELKKKGMDEKKLSNVAQDKQRNGDLAKLTEQGGPFTKEEQVDDFLKRTDLEDAVKNKRLYIEVRFAKNSSLSYPKSSDIFRLKQKGKNLSTSEYAVNLSTYLNKITCNVDMQFSDFKEALMKISED